MSGPLYVASRYLVHHRGKTIILVLAVALTGFVPVGLQVLVAQSARELTARADRTPLLVGSRGSPLELVLSALYFDTDPPVPIPWSEIERIDDTGLAQAVPLQVGFRAGGHPIVGTTLEYLDYRRLRVAAGRRMAWLGECVLGARAARELGLEPGDDLVSSPETVFDLAGVYPLKMRVVGVLAPSHTADDRAVFVDIKTAWVMAGLGHGHRDLGDPDASAAVLSRAGDRIVANAAVLEYNQITRENIESFHFHAGRSSLPVSAALALPTDERARVLLMGRYEAPDERVQILRPRSVMDELLDTVVTVQSYVVAGIALVAAATGATIVLVFMLSIRLRRREIETMTKIGGSRGSVAAVLISEVVVVVAVGLVIAAGLTLVTSRFGSAAIRAFLLS
jgi:putative ABC transport system permease protein